MIKTIRFLGTLNSVTATSFVEPAGDGGTFSQYAFANLICSVNSITGSTGRANITVSELFGNVVVPTAISGTITATTSIFCLENGNISGATGTAYVPPSGGNFVLLGSGGQKTIASNITAGTFGAFSVDVYMVYFSQ